MPFVPSFLVSVAVLVLVRGMPDEDCDCRVKDCWGGNACNLGGSLRVESSPSKLPVTKEKCNLFYKKEEFQKQPKYSFPDAKQDRNYSLVMVDPDADDLQPGEYYGHFVVANVPGSEFKNGHLEKGTILLDYVGPAPPQGTGNHRYMVLVYRQLTDVKVTGRVPAERRPHFRLGAWARRKGLSGPLSGVQFRSNYRGTECPTN